MAMRNRKVHGPLETQMIRLGAVNQVKAAIATLGGTDHTYTRLAAVPFVEFYNGTRVAGFARYAQNRLELHTGLFAKDRTQEFERTFFHEIGHFLDHWLLQGRKHGPTWRRAVSALGFPGMTTTHTYDFLAQASADKGFAKREKRFKWTCGCTVFTFTQNRDKSRHICRKCRRKLVPLTPEPKAIVIPSNAREFDSGIYQCSL